MLFVSILPCLNLADFINQHQEITQVEIIKHLPDLNSMAQNQDVIVHSFPQNVLVNPSISINYQDIFEAIFFSGMLLLLCKLIVQLISIFKLFKTSNPLIIKGRSIQHLEVDISPFSFFSYIFLNVNQHSESDLSEIIAHEYAHVKQGHSYDVMLGEVFCAVFWMNPFAWILRKFLKQNLEFLTDKTVLDSGFNARSYQLNLLKIKGLNISTMTNSFNLSDLKLRILMMNRKRSSKLHLVKYFFLIPLGAMLILVFNISKAKTFDAQKSVFQNLKETVKAVEFVGDFERKDVNDEDESIQDNTLSEGADIVSIIHDEIDSTKKYVRNYVNPINIRITEKETSKGVAGVKIFDDKWQLLGETNFQGICFFESPSVFKEILYDSIKVGNMAFRNSDKLHKIFFRYQNFKDVAYIFKNYPRTIRLFYHEGKYEVEPEMIYSNTVQITDDDKKNKANYPARLLDGSIWIEPQTKWFYCKEDMIKELKQTQELPESERPVYMTNGKVVADSYKFEDLSIYSVVNLRYWKPEDGQKMAGKYGKQAENGMYDLMVLEKVVLPKKEYKDILYPMGDYKPSKMATCTPSADFPSNALYVVDGKEVDSGFLHKNIKPEEIEKLTVMEKELARTKYGEKGKKGVILISTKKNDKLH